LKIKPIFSVEGDINTGLWPKNPDLKDRLLVVIKECENLMSQARALGSFKYYIAHDGEHLGHVWKNAELLIFDEQKGMPVKFTKKPFSECKESSELNDCEKFILGVSCYAHDLGMLAIVPTKKNILLTENYIESENIRKNHAKLAKQIISKYNIIPTDNKIPNIISQWVWKICRTHSNYKIDQMFRKVSLTCINHGDSRKIPSVDGGIIPYKEIKFNKEDTFIRPALLSAILRLSDEACYSKDYTLQHMDVIRKCLTDFESFMINEPFVYAENFEYLKEKFDNRELENFTDIYPSLENPAEVIPFIYKQIQEYWKHEIISSVDISHYPPNRKNKEHLIKIEVHPYKVGLYPKFRKDKKDKSIEEIVKEKFNDEKNQVSTIFDAYGVKIEMHWVKV